MSLLDRLSALVDKIKSDEVEESVIKERMEQMFSEIEKEKEEEDVSEEPIQEEEVATPEESSEEPDTPESEAAPEGFVPDMVEIPNEEIMSIIEVRQKIARLHSLIGQMVEDYEKRKQSALAALQATQSELEAAVVSLRDSHEIPSDVHYTIVFPKEPGASGAFVLKCF